MSLSPEGHVPEPEHREKKIPAWAIILIVSAIVLLVVICCLVVFVVLLPVVIYTTSQNWLPAYAFLPALMR